MLRVLGAVFKRRVLWVFVSLVLLAVVMVSLALASGVSDDAPAINDWPDPPVDTPPPAFTQAEMDAFMTAAMNYEMPLVVQGTELTLPDGALVDGLVAKTGTPDKVALDAVARIAAERASETPAPGETAPVYALNPLPLPAYNVIYDGEFAAVSKTTGEFQVGERYQETFQFLIDQLGQEKMQLIFNEVYELRWGPFRADYQEEE